MNEVPPYTMPMATRFLKGPAFGNSHLFRAVSTRNGGYVSERNPRNVTGLSRI